MNCAPVQGSKLQTLNQKHFSTLYLMKFWGTALLQFKCLKIPLKVFQRQLARISAAVEKDGAYAESKFQFSCEIRLNILTTTQTNQNASLISVTMTTSYLHVIATIEKRCMREIFFSKIYFGKIFVPRSELLNLICCYIVNRLNQDRIF